MARKASLAAGCAFILAAGDRSLAQVTPNNPYPQAPIQGQPYGYPPQQYREPYAQPVSPYPGQGYAQPQGGQFPPQMQMQQPGQGPLVAPPITFIDVNSGRFGKLEIDLTDGQFMDGAVDRLHLTAQNMDLTQGSLASLAVDVKGGHFQDFTFDQLSMNTQGALIFDTGVLFNHRMLQFNAPAMAQVQAVISQSSLNRFINSPRTLDRLSVAAGKKAAFLENLLGSTANLITFTGGNVQLLPENRMILGMQTRLGIANMNLPLELNTQLALREGWIYLADTRLSTAGQEISPQLSQMIVDKVNALSQFGHPTDDIQFNFTGLKVLPNDRFVLTGTAAIRRLRFGR